MNIRRPADIRRKRDKQNSKKLVIFAVCGACLLLLLIGAGFAIRQSALFEVRSITVVGVSDAYGQQIRKSLEEFSRQESTLFRLLGDRNMIAWGGNEKEFISANPDIKEMRINKAYFEHAVVVDVIGREKFGAWCHRAYEAPQGSEGATSTADSAFSTGESEECYWFDADGVLFAKAPLIRSELFNRIFDSTDRSLALHDKVLPDRLFQNLTRIFALLEIAQINTKTVYLSDLILEQVESTSVSDPRIIFSLRFDPAFSLSAIDALKKSGEWGKINYIDLRAENRAYYR